MTDDVNKPPHYTKHPSGIECIEITEHMNFCLGNAVKYIWRAGLKTDDPLKDLKKAAWYIEREIKRLSKADQYKALDELTRVSEELGLYESEQSKPKTSDWILWSGGECPVDLGQRVEVRFRSGEIDGRAYADEWLWEWGHSPNDYDIIAYRVVKE